MTWSEFFALVSLAVLLTAVLLQVAVTCDVIHSGLAIARFHPTWLMPLAHLQKNATGLPRGDIERQWLFSPLANLVALTRV